MTANFASMEAIRAALSELAISGFSGYIVVYSDSESVIKQCAGEIACHAPALARLLSKIKDHEDLFAGVRYRWIPKSQNAEATQMAWAAYRALRHGQAS